MTPTRTRSLAFGLLLAGGLLGLLLAGQSWWRYPTGPPVSGNDATSTLAGVLAGAVGAGTALAALLRTLGRRILGVLLTLLALGMIAAGIVAEPPPVTSVLATGEAAPTWVRVGYIAAAVVAAVGGVALTAFAHTWPAKPDRFAKLARAAAVNAEDDAQDVWKALDEGFDPTSTDGDTGETSGRKREDQRE